MWLSNRSLISWLRSGLVFITCVFLQNFSLYFIVVDTLVVSLLWLRLIAIMASFLRGLKSVRQTYFLWWGAFIIIRSRIITSNFFLFYVLFEFRLIPILLMILFWGNQPERLSAGLYFLIYTGIFSIPYLLLVLILLKNTKFCFLRTIISLSALRVILLLPFLVKMPVLGFHFWLPKAHVEASTSGSIILAGLMLKLGRYGVYRVVYTFKIITYLSRTCSFWLFSAILSSLFTFIQTDVKKLVAYRRVRHMTFIILALVSRNKTLFLSILMLSLAHGWASMGIFARAGLVSQVSSSRLGILASIEGKLRILALLVGLFLLSNASIPPFPSFFPELRLVLAARINRGITIFIFLLLRVFVCYYNAYIFIWVSHIKRTELIRRRHKKIELDKILLLIVTTFISLIWLKTT